MKWISTGRAARALFDIGKINDHVIPGYRNRHFSQPCPRIPGVGAGSDIELVSMPGADDMHPRLGERHALAGPVRGNDLLDLGDHLALTSGSAHVRKVVEIGEELAVQLEHRHLEPIESYHLSPGIREVRRRSDVHTSHGASLAVHLARLNHIETSQRLSPALRINALTVTTTSVGVTMSGLTGRALEPS